jgi:hypothetical protein
MSDINTQRQIRALQTQVGRTKTADMTAIYLPFSQRTLNPFPLASSPGGWGDAAMPWSLQMLAFSVSVFVNTTNTGAAFWTIAIQSSTTTLASVSTSAIAANTWARLSTTTITQPASSNAIFTIIATATGSPGSIYIVPLVEVVRTG